MILDIKELLIFGVVMKLWLLFLNVHLLELYTDVFTDELKAGGIMW